MTMTQAMAYPIARPYGPTPMAYGCYGTERNGTERKSSQDSEENSSVSYPRTPVDNPKSVRSEMQLAEFIDSTLTQYAKSGEFRAALHAEAPGAPPTVPTICPPSHRHAETDTCYGYHKCRCGPCRERSASRQKQQRMARARAAWNER